MCTFPNCQLMCFCFFLYIVIALFSQGLESPVNCLIQSTGYVYMHCDTVKITPEEHQWAIFRFTSSLYVHLHLQHSAEFTLITYTMFTMLQHNVYVCLCVYTVIFVFINTKLCSAFSESHGAEGETLWLYRTSEMKWPTAFLSVFGSHIQGPSVHMKLDSAGREGWKGKWQ